MACLHGWPVALFTRILFDPLVTQIALHVTAPLELAATLPSAFDLVRVVATATAQQVTSVHSGRRAIAMAAVGAQRTETEVLLAVVGRLMEVNHFHALRRLFGNGCHSTATENETEKNKNLAATFNSRK